MSPIRHKNVFEGLSSRLANGKKQANLSFFFQTSFGILLIISTVTDVKKHFNFITACFVELMNKSLRIKLFLKFILQTFAMTVFHFHRLSEKQQLDILENSGVFVAERQGAFYNIRLYQLESFYVELYYHTHFNVVVNINCFTNTDCLDPYLEAIDVEALIDA